MMNFFIFFALLSFFVFLVNDAHALLVSEDPVGEMDVVVVGTIVSAVPGTDSYGAPETKYVVDVEEIIKGSALLEDGINTKSLEFVAPGALGEQNNASYRKIFAINDRALLMLEQRDGNLHESLWSRIAPNNCSGNKIIQLFSAPGGLEISQDELDPSHFYTNHPISAQYSFFNKNLTATMLNVTINVVGDFPDIYHSESFVLNLDECQAYETATTEFVIDKPGSISIHTVVNGETSHGIGGLDVVEYILSPLQQFKSGIPADEIRCRENLTFSYKHDDSPVCIKPESKSELIKRNWLKPHFSFCGADGFDSQGHLNKSNSTHIWNDNYCTWEKKHDDASNSDSPLSEFTTIDSLLPEDRLQVKNKAGYTVIHITLSSWDEYKEWENRRGPEYIPHPPITITDDNMNPIVFDMLYEMWQFEGYETSEHNPNLYRKTIQKDYSVPNHHGIRDWMGAEYNKQYGESSLGLGVILNLGTIFTV